MSIVIKGMKMPKACTKCLFFIESYSPSFPFVECKFIGRLGSVFNFNNDVPIDCPLIELPPHGRLIDADAFEKHIKDDWEEYDHWIAVDVENRPTILEAEESER